MKRTEIDEFLTPLWASFSILFALANLALAVTDCMVDSIIEHCSRQSVLRKVATKFWKPSPRGRFAGEKFSGRLVEWRMMWLGR